VTILSWCFDGTGRMGANDTLIAVNFGSNGDGTIECICQSSCDCVEVDTAASTKWSVALADCFGDAPALCSVGGPAAVAGGCPTNTPGGGGVRPGGGSSQCASGNCSVGDSNTAILRLVVSIHTFTQIFLALLVFVPQRYGLGAIGLGWREPWCQRRDDGLPYWNKRVLSFAGVVQHFAGFSVHQRPDLQLCVQPEDQEGRLCVRRPTAFPADAAGAEHNHRASHPHPPARHAIM
jgi:hypothetical protein